MSKQKIETWGDLKDFANQLTTEQLQNHITVEDGEGGLCQVEGAFLLAEDYYASEGEPAEPYSIHEAAGSFHPNAEVEVVLAFKKDTPFLSTTTDY